MSSPTARSARITRRTLGISLLGAIGVAAIETWPVWKVWQGKTDSLSLLAALPQAVMLRQLGARVLASSPLSLAEVESRLAPRLAQDGYEGAVARDRESGTLMAVNGWHISESQALAGAWLVLKAQ